MRNKYKDIIDGIYNNKHVNIIQYYHSFRNVFLVKKIFLELQGNLTCINFTWSFQISWKLKIQDIHMSASNPNLQLKLDKTGKLDTKLEQTR